MSLLHREEIKKELSRARKSLKSARTLFGEGLFEDALSRSYYAVLHAAKAVLLSEEVSIDSHEAVKRLFGMHLVRTGKIEKRYSKILSKEQDDRYLADYDVAFEPARERVEERINEAEDFLNAMTDYLKTNYEL